VLEETRTKLDSKGVKFISIGYYEKTNGYLLYNTINQYVIISHDIIFDEFKYFNEETMFSRLLSELE
jgi:hypothetical protein